MTDGTNVEDRNTQRKLTECQPLSLPVPNLVARTSTRKKFLPGVRRRMSLAAPRKEPPPEPYQLPPRPRAKFLDLRPDGPFRPPDYRWQTALYLNEKTYVPPGWVDRGVLLGEELLTTDIKRAGNPPDLVAGAAARELYEAGPFWKQVEVEARLLANEAVGAIAMKTGLTEAAVDAYEQLYYAVRDRLQHRGAITHLVIQLHTKKAEHDVGIHIRSLAYTGGPFIVDCLLDAIRSEAAGGDTGEVSGELRRQRKSCLINLKLRMTPITDGNMMRWFQIDALQRELTIRRSKPVCSRRGANGRDQSDVSYRK